MKKRLTIGLAASIGAVAVASERAWRQSCGDPAPGYRQERGVRALMLLHRQHRYGGMGALKWLQERWSVAVEPPASDSGGGARPWRNCKEQGDASLRELRELGQLCQQVLGQPACRGRQWHDFVGQRHRARVHGDDARGVHRALHHGGSTWIRTSSRTSSLGSPRMKPSMPTRRGCGRRTARSST